VLHVIDSHLGFENLGFDHRRKQSRHDSRHAAGKWTGFDLGAEKEFYASLSGRFDLRAKRGVHAR